MRRLCALLLLLFATTAYAGAHRELIVAEPYIEMHTGPGVGFPVFFVVGRGDKITVLLQRTNWYLVREHQGREGWVTEDQLLKTLETDGKPVNIVVPSLENLAKRRFEGAVMFGDFGGATLIDVSASYGLSDHLSIELNVGQALGNIFDSNLATLSLTHMVLPDKRISPYITIGTGKIHSYPHTTQAQKVDSTEQLSFVGAGLRVYLTRRFIARAEYDANYIYTKRNQNEDAREWKAGFAFFF
jgi:uncharacterized protein YgiM (DUF1202 family)